MTKRHDAENGQKVLLRNAMGVVDDHVGDVDAGLVKTFLIPETTSASGKVDEGILLFTIDNDVDNVGAFEEITLDKWKSRLSNPLSCPFHLM